MAFLLCIWNRTGLVFVPNAVRGSPDDSKGPPERPAE